MTTTLYNNVPQTPTSPAMNHDLDDPFSSIHRLSTSSTQPPPYSPSSSSSFDPTLQLQIETPGKPWLSLPLPPRPDPIPIYAVPPSFSSLPSPSGRLSSSGDPSTQDPEPTYVSLRPTRCSGSSLLATPTSTTALATTVYRFGPSRPPVVTLYRPGGGPRVDDPFASASSSSSPPGNQGEDVDLGTIPWDTTTLQTPLLSRTTTFRTRLGTFSWRYGTRKERRARNASSLLIMERIVRVAGARDMGVKDSEARRAVAMLVRNDEVRSVGSGGSSAGNGGRLLVDLAGFDNVMGVGDEKNGEEQEMIKVLVVSSALVMLKKEVDRRRAQQIAIMAGAGGS
ncbi:hypothetical protein OQA88_11424 [Cercophora sp. LCS_1]